MLPRVLAFLLAASAFTGTESFAQCPADDTFEDNDTPSTASVLPVGTTTGLFVHGGAHPNGPDFDYWLIPAVPQGHQVVVDFHNVTFNERLRVLLSPTQYGNPTGATSALQDERIVDSNPAAFAQDYVLEVSPQFNNDALVCDEYTLTLSVVPDPCIAANDDALEDNDSCNSPTVLTPGTYTGLRMTPEDRDFYTVVVPTGQELVVDQTDPGEGMGLKLNPQDECMGSGYYTRTHFNGPGGTRTLTFANDSGQPLAVSVQSLIWGPSCAFYDLSITLVPSECSMAVEDVFEPNDDCASSAPIAAGSLTNLFMSRTSPDHYSVQVPADTELALDLDTTSGSALVSLELFSDPACTLRVDDASGSNASVRWTNPTGSPATIYAKCAIEVQSVGNCAQYDLAVALLPNSCITSFEEDLYEDNDTCATATPLFHGFDPSLGLRNGDDDFYTVTLQGGEYIGVYVMENEPDVVIEAFVYRSSGVCGDTTNGFLYYNNSDSSDQTADFLLAQPGFTPGTYILQVRIAAGSTRSCARYDLFTRSSSDPNARLLCVGDGSAGLPGAHDTACPCGNASAPGSGEGCVNSQGHGARIRLVGAPTAFTTPSELYFTLSRARANTPALLLQGAEPIARPFRDGILCMGNPTERIETLFTDAAGSATSTTDAAVAGLVDPGDVRYYQFWYRDPMLSPCGSGSNFSSALSVRIE